MISSFQNTFEVTLRFVPGGDSKKSKTELVLISYDEGALKSSLRKTFTVRYNNFKG